MTRRGYNTTKLLKLLENAPGKFFEKCVKSQGANYTFQEYLLELMQEKSIGTSELIVKARLSKTYAYQMVNGERIPGRDILLRIAIVLTLDVISTNRLLTLAGKNVLYPKVRRDAAIMFCLSKKSSLPETNEFLASISEPLLL